MKLVVEALVPVTINCVEAPAFALKKGEKKEFTEADFRVYSANVQGAQQAGWVKVEVLGDSKADPKSAKADAAKEAADAKIKSDKEAAEKAKKEAEEAKILEEKEQVEAAAAKEAAAPKEEAKQGIGSKLFGKK